LLLMKELAEKCFVIFDFLVSGVNLLSKCLSYIKKEKTMKRE